MGVDEPPRSGPDERFFQPLRFDHHPCGADAADRADICCVPGRHREDAAPAIPYLHHPGLLDLVLLPGLGWNEAGRGLGHRSALARVVPSFPSGGNSGVGCRRIVVCLESCDQSAKAERHLTGIVVSHPFHGEAVKWMGHPTGFRIAGLARRKLRSAF